MRNRNGTTLTEVLIAIFIMAIGMMSLLSLFPVGALSMAQAIKDERAAQAAANAAAIAEAREIRHNPPVVNWFNRMLTPNTSDPYSLTKNDPNYNGPSFPIYVDPLGSIFDPISKTIGSNAPGIPRVTMTMKDPLNNDVPVTATQAFRWFGLLDDLTYQDPALSGALYGVPSNPVQREGRHSWAYLVQRPNLRDAGVANVSVVVYNARSQLAGLGERVYSPVAFHSPSDQIVNSSINPAHVRIDYDAMLKPKPDIRKGHWIFDATVQRPVGSQSVPEPHGHFYRVVSVIDTVDGSGRPALLLELQSPASQSTDLDPLNPENRRYGVLVFMEGVSEVLDRGAGWQP